MEAIKETTVWKEGAVSNHTYLLDGSHLVAYIKQGETVPFFFSKPIKNFDRRGRSFVKVQTNLFGTEKKTNLREVAGSKGATYYVDDEAKTCTCAGFTFRGACKHIG
jgi:hypothetical protein